MATTRTVAHRTKELGVLGANGVPRTPVLAAPLVEQLMAAVLGAVTMYDAEGFQVVNELDRFAIGDREALRYNPDGSLNLHVQHANPGPGHESNWLAAPPGPLGVTMRLYAPKAQVLDGRWVQPPVRRA